MYETTTTTNSELFENEVKATVSNEPKSSLLSSSPSLVQLCPGIDQINVLSWSQVNLNASGTCVLVSRIIYGVEMTVFWKGSDCLNAENACSDLDLDFDLDCLSGEQDEDSLLLHGDCLSFEGNLLEYEQLLYHDRCLHLSSLL